MIHALLVLAFGGVTLLLSLFAWHGWRRPHWFRRLGHAPILPVETSHNELADESSAALRFPLSRCRLGESVCLQCLEVDHCVIHRLRELGLTPGVELSVVQDAGGPLLIAVRGSRVALGRDLADSLYVIPVDRIPVMAKVSPDKLPK